MNHCAVLSWILVCQLGFLVRQGRYSLAFTTKQADLCALKNPEKIVHAKLLQSCLTLWDPMDHSPPGSSVHGFSSQEYWSGLPFPPPREFPDPGIEPSSLLSPALEGGFFTTSATWEAPEKIESWLNHSIKEINHQWLKDSDSSSSLYFNLKEFL